MSAAMDRREFLAVLGGGLTVIFTVDLAALLPVEAQQRGYPTDLNAYLRVGEDGRVSLFTGKIEMGQGIHTSLAQMLAEELDVTPDVIDPVMGDTDVTPWDMGTFGSMTTRFFGPPLRRAGAEAREALLELAAERLDVPMERLDTRDGRVFDRQRPDAAVSYGDLVRGRRLERRASGDVSLEPMAEHTVCGVPTARMDGRSKVTGEARYAGDVRLPDMLHAAILRPPAHGSRLRDADATGAEAVEGARVVRDGELVAVLHERPDVAEEALGRVNARWDVPDPVVDNATIFDHLDREMTNRETVSEAGSLDSGRAMTARAVEATYRNQYVAHAPIETHTALAAFEDDRLTVWASTQTPFPARDEIARALGMAPEDVRVITPFVGGGFGGKTANLQAVEAARLARLAGRPVQVAWTRKEEFFHDTFRPAGFVRITAGLDEGGSPVLWELETVGAGPGGSEPQYRLPHHRVTARGGWMGPQPGHPLAVGAWRAPSANTNYFAIESHIDMMAAAAGVDPVTYRLDHLADERARGVLRAAADRFGGDFVPAPSGRGHGVAVALEVGTWVAAIAQVDVDEERGTVRVERIVCAQDMGEIINPRGAILQSEGALTMGLGYVLGEEVRFEGGAVLDENFGSYQIPRFSWVPEIEVVLVENPDLSPQGGGEPAITVMGAVVANAVHDACGARVYDLPMTPARVKDALAAGPVPGA
jgi:nicotinate dehydrogenase subunit B